jgi:deoxyribodipyrimidine photolyase-like uncharacterized protein
MKIKHDLENYKSLKYLKLTVMQEISLIFPNQLFLSNPILAKGRVHYIVECDRYFTDFFFHKKKLLFHRATMKNYESILRGQKFHVEYINSKQFQSTPKFISKYQEKLQKNPRMGLMLKILEKKKIC